ncbi:hypothetical protein LCGC14_2891810, partial [marine sediment metagenome]
LGLKTLYGYIGIAYSDSELPESMRIGDVAGIIIEAMIVPCPSEDSEDFLMCLHCRSLIPVEKFKSGELWDESAEASRKAAREAEKSCKEATVITLQEK